MHNAKPFKLSVDLSSSLIVFIVKLIMLFENNSNINYISKYVSNEFKRKNKIILLFSLNKKYVEFQNLFKVINVYIKQHDYSIYIFKFSKN